MTGPAPVPHDHVGVRIAAMHTLLDHRNDFRDDFDVRSRAAARTLGMRTATRAVGQVLRRGNGKDPAEIRHFGEQMRQRVAKPLANLRTGRAHGDVTETAHAGDVLVIAQILMHAGHVRAMLKEGSRHRPRLVHVQIHPDAEAPRSVDQPSQIRQALLVALAELGKLRPTRRKLPQHHMQPDPVDTERRQPRQQTVRIRIQRPVHQRITESCEIRVDVAQLVSASSGPGGPEAR